MNTFGTVYDLELLFEDMTAMPLIDMTAMLLIGTTAMPLTGTPASFFIDVEFAEQVVKHNHNKGGGEFTDLGAYIQCLHQEN